MGQIWFTADTHFLNPDILKYCKRPISPEDHDDWLISRINERVSKKDTLYILGDISMANRARTEIVLSRIHGYKHLIIGNHDSNIKNSTLFRSSALIRTITPRINNEKIKIVLCHYPIASWEDKALNSYHLHGHTHARFINSGLSWDVGVDNNNYQPISLEEVINLINIKNDKKSV